MRWSLRANHVATTTPCARRSSRSRNHTASRAPSPRSWSRNPKPTARPSSAPLHPESQPPHPRPRPHPRPHPPARAHTLRRPHSCGWPPPWSTAASHRRPSSRWSARTSAASARATSSASSVAARGTRPPTRARVVFAQRGPTGHPMGIVHVMEQDGRGHVSVRPRPFVIMNEGAEVDLGTFD